MGDKKHLLDKYGVKMKHFIFTGDAKETDKIINAFLEGSSLGMNVRRIKE